MLIRKQPYLIKTVATHNTKQKERKEEARY